MVNKCHMCGNDFEHMFGGGRCRTCHAEGVAYFLTVGLDPHVARIMASSYLISKDFSEWINITPGAWKTIRGIGSQKSRMIYEAQRKYSETHIQYIKAEKIQPKTLRDEFALGAMTGICLNWHEPSEELWTTDDIAEEAYRIADAMMKARKNPAV